MISDMEENDGKACESEGRSGDWVTYNDGTGEIWPAAQGHLSRFSPMSECLGKSSVAFHTTGYGFTGWGAAAGIKFSKTPWNGSKYSGIAFRGRSPRKNRIFIKVATHGTLDAAYGGACEPAAGKACSDHYAKAVQLSDAWTYYSVPFSDLRQEGWGVRVDKLTPDLTQLMEVHFVFPRAGVTFDVWLDDVTFTR
jgi:hypothetical protein